MLGKDDPDYRATIAAEQEIVKRNEQRQYIQPENRAGIALEQIADELTRIRALMEEAQKTR